MADTKSTKSGFTAEERDAMKQRADQHCAKRAAAVHHAPGL